MNQFLIKALIWLVSHGQIQPCFFVYDALVMGEGAKAFFAVIGAHTALAKSAEAHFTGGKMNHRIVDAATAETAA